MFAYYLQLGLRSLKRNPILTALMIVGIAMGIAASMTTLTVMHLMGSDPIPWKSDKLHYVQLDNWGADGWELVAVIPGMNPENLVAYLKRPLPEEK